MIKANIQQLDLLVEAVKKAREPAQAGLNENGSNCSSSTKVNKISWKSVAQYIWANGGSYLYGNATCKKKWTEIQGTWPGAGA